MAQNLNSDRRDNRGGHKPVTSTKKLFIYRVERSKHEELKAYAIKLNEEVEYQKDKYYTLLKIQIGDSGKEYPKDLGLNLSFDDAEIIKQAKTNSLDRYDSLRVRYELKEIPSDPCNTTEK